MIREFVGGCHIIGDGAIARALHNVDCSPASNHFSGETTSPYSLVFAAMDRFDQRFFEQTYKVASDYGVPIVPVFGLFGEIVIGPPFRYHQTGQPEQPACFTCWSMRYFNWRPGHRNLFDGSAKYITLRPVPISPSLAALAAELAIRFSFAEISGEETSVSAKTVRYVSETGANVQDHSFIAHPECPVCNKLPLDNAEYALVELRRRPKSKRDDDRMANLHQIGPIVRKRVVDDRTGIVQEVGPSDLCSGLAAAGASLYFETRPRLVERTGGVALSYGDACSVATLEALERYSGLRPRGRIPQVYSSLAKLGETAIDPRQFGLYEDATYWASEALTAFTPELEMTWCWANVLACNRAVLVPKQLAYYASRSAEPLFVLEGSQGCAIGSCYEETVYHGLMEVVERDAFMLAWYRRDVAARIDTQTIRDETSRLLIRRFETLGYDVSIFDISTEFDICAIWVLLIRRDGGTPYSFNIAAAGVIPEKVVQKALRELTPIMQAHIAMFKTGSLEEQRAQHLAASSEEVVEMSDHALRYFVPETAGAFGFALDVSQTISMTSLTEKSAYLVSDDLCEDLSRVVDVFERRGHNVIVVDQTSYEQEALGLCTTKVLVPGMLTLHFGESRRRFRGIPRMAAMCDISNTLNTDPHPFP